METLQRQQALDILVEAFRLEGQSSHEAEDAINKKLADMKWPAKVLTPERSNVQIYLTVSDYNPNGGQPIGTRYGLKFCEEKPAQRAGLLLGSSLGGKEPDQELRVGGHNDDPKYFFDSEQGKDLKGALLTFVALLAYTGHNVQPFIPAIKMIQWGIAKEIFSVSARQLVFEYYNGQVQPFYNGCQWGGEKDLCDSARSALTSLIRL